MCHVHWTTGACADTQQNHAPVIPWAAGTLALMDGKHDDCIKAALKVCPCLVCQRVGTCLLVQAWQVFAQQI